MPTFTVWGHGDLGEFPTPEAARAAAWSVTPAGEECPKILAWVIDPDAEMTRIAAQRLFNELTALLPIAEQIGSRYVRQMRRILEDLGEVEL